MSIRNGRVYRQYINSSAWESRRERYFTSHPRTCAACGAGDDIHLHHKTYERMGSEPDSDLMPLCGFCHSTLHHWHQAVGGDLFSVSDEFVAQFRQSPGKGVEAEPASGFVPRHLRGAARDEKGRLVSVSDWRDEVRDIRTHR